MPCMEARRVDVSSSVFEHAPFIFQMHNLFPSAACSALAIP